MLYNQHTISKTLASNVIKIGIVASILLSSACTGPFGMVLGGADVHESYNRRQEIQLGIENLRETDRAELDDLIGRVK